jgi:predicted membrane channel-forming protein YqfA (hemolysin III family)
MYAFLLTLHSLVRWLVLISLLVAIVRAYQGWLNNQPFTKRDNNIRTMAVTTAHIQLVLGICLYAISPVVRYFLNYFKEAVHQREIRFFGMEHVTMMVIAIVLLTIGSAKAKRKKTDNQKFRTMAIWFTIALVIIFLSIPWHFSPFTSRPYFRWF